MDYITHTLTRYNMTVTPLQWNLLVRILWKIVRPHIVKIVNDSTNTVDDTVLEVADALAGTTKERE